MAYCHGNGADHCCYLGGEVCPFLEENTVEGRRWACGLFRRSGSWANVYESSAYRRRVKPRLEASGHDFDCGDWPQDTNDLGVDRCCWNTEVEVSLGYVG